MVLFITNAKVLPKFNQTIKEFPYIYHFLPLLATLPIISHRDPMSSDSQQTGPEYHLGDDCIYTGTMKTRSHQREELFISLSRFNDSMIKG